MKNKVLIVILIFFISIYYIKAQNFEGIIKYKATQISNGLTKPKLQDTYYIKDKKLKSFSIDGILFKDTAFYYLENQEGAYMVNHSLQKIENDISRCNDNFDTRTLKKTKKSKEILGFLCILYKGVNREYWIADSLKTQINYGEIFMKNFGTVLLMKTELKDKDIIYEVTEIVPAKINEAMFELPEYPVKKIDMSKQIK